MGVERRAIAAAVLVLATGACRPGVPSDLDDACAIFDERPDWHRAVSDAHALWGVAPPIQLAFVHQESRFRAEARPPRRRFLGLIPLGRLSSAYGYGQVQDGTWGEYRAAERRHAKRDRFADVADFIGWYADRVHRRLGIPKTDAYHLYLAYHEGPTGFQRASYAAKPWLLEVARMVRTRAETYATQYPACPSRDPRNS